MDRVLIIFGTQVRKEKRTVQPKFSDYLAISYHYDLTKMTLISAVNKGFSVGQ